jgi:antitoxin YefM
VQENQIMKVKSYGEFQRNLEAILDSVTEHREPVIISREHGKPAAVLMSLEDFASYEETHYLLQSQRNAERLLKSIAELEAGKD